MFSLSLYEWGRYWKYGNKWGVLNDSKRIKGKIGNIKYKNVELDKINNLVLDSVVDAHFKAKVYSNIIELDCISAANIGKLCAFFMLSAAYSGYLFDVNPFNQPGVEVYKECVRNNLSEVLKWKRSI